MKLRSLGGSLWSWWATRWTLWRGPDYLTSLYQKMHLRGQLCGVEWQKHVEVLQETIPCVKQKTILDFGCGPYGGLSADPRFQVMAYDPGVKKYQQSKWDTSSFDVFFSVDVFEHLLPQELEGILEKLAALQPGYLFLVISLRRAKNLLPNRANAHLIVQKAPWWKTKIQTGLGGKYQILYESCDSQRKELTLVLSHQDLERLGEPR